MGFDGLFFSRVDYNDKVQRLNDKTMEMVWRPSRSLAKATDLFTGILIRGYSSPPGFCFDQRCSVPPMQVNVYRVYISIARRFGVGDSSLVVWWCALTKYM